MPHKNNTVSFSPQLRYFVVAVPSVQLPPCASLRTKGKRYLEKQVKELGYA